MWLKYQPEKIGFLLKMLRIKQSLCCHWMLLHRHISISSFLPFLWWETRDENKITVRLIEFNESFLPPSACSINLVIRLYYVSFNVLETVLSKCWQHFAEKSQHHTHQKRNVLINIHWSHWHSFSFIFTVHLSSVLCLLQK